MKSEAQFTPLRTASPFVRVVVLLLGPVTWFVALIVGSLVLSELDAIEIGLIVTLGAFFLAVPFCWLGRHRRLREQNEAKTS